MLQEHVTDGLTALAAAADRTCHPNALIVCAVEHESCSQRLTLRLRCIGEHGYDTRRSSHVAYVLQEQFADTRRRHPSRTPVADTRGSRPGQPPMSRGRVNYPAAAQP